MNARTLGDIIADRLADEAAGLHGAAPIGHNNPPEETPPELTIYDVALKSVTDIVGEAELWLDGAEVLDQQQADGLALILDTARKAKKLADENRKTENEPFDKGKAEVQARYNPLIASCDQVMKAVQAALGAWKVKQDKIIADRQAEANRVAAAAAEEARKAREQVDLSNLAEVRAAEEATRIAEDAAKAAKEASRERTTAKGATSARAVSYRTVWTAKIVDRRAALNAYAKRNPDGLTAWVQAQADADCHGTPGAVDGVEFTSQQVAR